MTEEQTTEDARVFGAHAWIYCRQHLRPHETGWCTVDVDQKVKLDATSMEAAYTECKERDFHIYSGDK